MYRPPPAAQQPQYRTPQRRAPAQRSAPAAPPPPPPVAAGPEPPPAPYEPELLRMAEIIGSVAFLRSLCAAPDAGEWPQRMQQLIEAEGTTPGRKERLAGAYNKGYRAFALTYRICTPSATEATNRYLQEGDRLSRQISSRYGG